MLLKITKNKKEYEISWYSTQLSPGEIWINLNLPEEKRIPEIVKDFDQTDFVIDDQPVNGYSALTHVMTDDSVTIRIKKE